MISGRPTAFLAEVLGAPPGVTLAGLYGLERALQGPAHDTWASVIDEVVAEATATAPEGVYVEPKGLTVTLHWRHVPEHEGWVLAFAARQRDARGLMVVQGRHERELRPPLDVDKGTVVRALVAEHDVQAAHGNAARRRPPPSATTSATCPPSPRSARSPRAHGPATPRRSRWCGSPPSTRRARRRWRRRPT